MDKYAVELPESAIKEINEIISSGNDVLVKYRQNKGEIDIIEQKITVNAKFPVTTK